jgi:hypothetical protein
MTAACDDVVVRRKRDEKYTFMAWDATTLRKATAPRLYEGQL